MNDKLRAIALRREYINHLNMHNKKPLMKWERKRKEIHDRIFKEVGLKRNSKEGKEFSRKFDRSIELELKSLTEVFAKRICNAKTKEDMEHEEAQFEFIKKWSKK